MKKVRGNTLSEAETETILDLLWATWQGIAGDIMDSVRMMDGKTTILRGHVIEVTLDADCPTMFIRTAEERTAYDKFKRLPYDVQIRIAALRFTSARYC